MSHLNSWADVSSICKWPLVDCVINLQEPLQKTNKLINKPTLEGSSTRSHQGLFYRKQTIFSVGPESPWLPQTGLEVRVWVRSLDLKMSYLETWNKNSTNQGHFLGWWQTALLGPLSWNWERGRSRDEEKLSCQNSNWRSWFGALRSIIKSVIHVILILPWCLVLQPFGQFWFLLVFSCSLKIILHDLQ